MTIPILLLYILFKKRLNRFFSIKSYDKDLVFKSINENNESIKKYNEDNDKL